MTVPSTAVRVAAAAAGHPAPAAEGLHAVRTDASAPATAAPRRVLYVLSQFPSLSETFIAREIQALIDRGVDVRILSLKTPAEGIVQPQAAALAHRVLYPAHGFSTLLAFLATLVRHPLAMVSFFAILVSGFWRNPVALGKSVVAVLRAIGRVEVLRRFDPQLVHAPWATYPATVAWLLSRLLRRPYSFTSRAHDIFIEDHMMARKLRTAALAVTITEFNRRFMARWMPAPDAVPVRVIHSSLNLPELPFVREGRAPAKLLSVGRLVPMKGFDILLAACAELRSRGISFECTIIGEGPERARLEALRTKLGLDSLVHLPGPMPQPDVIRNMREATLMVLPCVVAPNGQSDGIPNVLMESMAAGLPVVSTRISGIPELVEDGVNGRLVPANDASALAGAVQALLLDPEAREAYALAGRRKVERDFDVRVEAGKLLAHFAEACRA